MDMPNDELDARMSSCLQADSHATSEQKAQMWKNIYRQAQAQTMLPKESVSVTEQFIIRLTGLIETARSLIRIFITDETRYHRVNDPFYRHHLMQPHFHEARFTFTTLALKYSF